MQVVGSEVVSVLVPTTIVPQTILLPAFICLICVICVLFAETGVKISIYTSTGAAPFLSMLGGLFWCVALLQN